jgi:hypothetical protein
MRFSKLVSLSYNYEGGYEDHDVRINNCRNSSLCFIQFTDKTLSAGTYIERIAQKELNERYSV